jgi:hypothetical protein
MPKISIKKYTDPYINNVSLFLPFNSNFNDNSSNNFSVTAYGNTQISSTQSKFGGSSAYFDGIDSVLITNDISLSTQDFTLESWIYLTTYGDQNNAIFNQGNYDNTGAFLVLIGSATDDRKLIFYADNNERFRGTTTIPLNTWTNITVTRQSNIYYFFINGVLEGNHSATYNHNQTPFKIGDGYGGVRYFNGYIDEVRITQGIARYTSNFIPRSILPNNNKLKLINSIPFIRDSTYIRNTVLPILRSSITNFYNYSYDGGSTYISDGGHDMYDVGNQVFLNGVLQSYDTESADTFCYRSYPFIYKTTQTSNFTLSVQGNYGSDGSETMYQYQQDFIHQGRRFSIYIHENIDNSRYDPSIVECFIVLYPISKPTINFTFANSGSGNTANETISVSNLNGQSVTAFYLLLSNYPAVRIGSATLFDVLKTFVVNCAGVSSFNQKLTVKTPQPFSTNGLLAFWRLNNPDGLSTISSDFGSYTLQVGGFGYQSAVGKINNCFYFADSSKGLFTNQQILNQTTNPQNFSCAFWYKTPNSTNYVFTCGSAFGSLGFHFDYLGTQYQYSYGLGMKFSVATGNQNNGNSWGYLTVGSLFDTDTWYHIVGTYDLFSQTMKLYVNGSLVGTLTGVISSGNEHPDWHGFGLNGSVRYNDKEYGGNQYLDAVGIWNKALTPTEVAQLYNGGNGSEI